MTHSFDRSILVTELSSWSVHQRPRISDNLTDVGAYVDSVSPYGTLDQGGNVWEWNETLISGVFRRSRGGSFRDDASGTSPELFLNSFNGKQEGFPSSEIFNVGFRVATIPEPSTVTLAAFGLIGLTAFGWWRRMR